MDEMSMSRRDNDNEPNSKGLKGVLQNMSAKKAFAVVFISAIVAAITICFCLILITGPYRGSLDYGTRTFDMINTGLMFSFVLLTLLAVIGASYFIWRVKFQKPLAMLMKGTEHIKDSDLDFSLEYEANDEMGKLCASFEKMRQELYQSKIKSWRSIEERKRLNAAFAHDLRTPLTVLRGYTDFLGEYIPSPDKSDEKLLETNEKMTAAIDRVENYVKTMSEIQRLEDTPIEAGEIDKDEFEAIIDESVRSIGIEFLHPIHFGGIGNFRPVIADTGIIRRVIENLLRNGCSHTVSAVKLDMRMEGSILKCRVEDDGLGFSEDYLQKVFTPFYHSEQKGFGMGLYICKVLCENHGGYIHIANSPKGGAVVEAGFLTRECERKN